MRLSILSQSFLFFNSFFGKADFWVTKRTKAVRGRWAACMAGGWKKRGKSNRPKAPPDGHRSDSTGIVDQFPSQRSSGSVREALRLTRPPELRNAKIFLHLCRCPPSTHAACPGLRSGFSMRKVINGILSVGNKRINCCQLRHALVHKYRLRPFLGRVLL